MSWLSFRFLYPWVLALIPVLLIIYGFKSHQLKKINQPARLKMSSLPGTNQKLGHWIRTFLTVSYASFIFFKRIDRIFYHCRFGSTSASFFYSRSHGEWSWVLTSLNVRRVWILLIFLGVTVWSCEKNSQRVCLVPLSWSSWFSCI